MARGFGKSGKTVEERVEQKEARKRYHLEAGETVKLTTKDTPHYDRTEAPPGIMVGKKPKFQ